MLMRGLNGLTLMMAMTAVSSSALADDVDDHILKAMSRHHLPSISAAAVHGDRIVWAKAYGLADLESATPATTDTVYLWASVSKPVTATAVMQLWEAGEFELDDPVSVHLPFVVGNPNHPGVPITIRQLLSHTSSIHDTEAILAATISFGSDSFVPLGQWLQGYLTPGRAYYAPSNYLSSPPGFPYHYGNVNYALLGLLVEAVSGLSFEEYCQKNIFGPLGMEPASFMLAGVEGEPLASLYDLQGDPPYFYAPHNMTVFPAGFLRTPPGQLAKFLTAFVNDGAAFGTQLLEPSTIQLMQIPVTLNEYYGLGLHSAALGSHSPALWHNGLWLGCTSLLVYAPQENTGVVIVTNSINILDVGHIQDVIQDLGDYLLTQFSTTPPVIGDLNGDRIVNGVDLGVLLSQWFAPSGSSADLNADGAVNGIDLGILLANWTV